MGLLPLDDGQTALEIALLGDRFRLDLSRRRLLSVVLRTGGPAHLAGTPLVPLLPRRRVAANRPPQFDPALLPRTARPNSSGPAAANRSSQFIWPKSARAAISPTHLATCCSGTILPGTTLGPSHLTLLPRTTLSPAHLAVVMLTMLSPGHLAVVTTFSQPIWPWVRPPSPGHLAVVMLTILAMMAVTITAVVPLTLLRAYRWHGPWCRWCPAHCP